jgi:hypothetical protein
VNSPDRRKIDHEIPWQNENRRGGLESSPASGRAGRPAIHKKEGCRAFPANCAGSPTKRGKARCYLRGRDGAALVGDGVGGDDGEFDKSTIGAREARG